MPDHQLKPRSSAVPAPTPAPTPAEELFAGIEALTNPTRERSVLGDESSPWVTSPSLWDQLIGNTARAAGVDSSVARSRPPVSTAVLSLVAEVRDACQLRLSEVNRKPIVRTRTVPDELRPRVQARPDSTVIELWRDIPAELRAIRSTLPPPPHPLWGVWIRDVRGWVAKAQGVLGLVPPRITLPRGTRCLDCERAWVVTVDEEGKEIRQPALSLVWHENGTLHFVRCSACGGSRWPYDLHALAEHQARMNREHDTLAVTESTPVA